MLRPVAPMIALVSLALSGCQNSCQRLCVDMADYAASCGVTVADADVDACIDDQADSDDLASCGRVGDPDTLRREWSCEDVASFFP